MTLSPGDDEDDEACQNCGSLNLEDGYCVDCGWDVICNCPGGEEDE